MRLAVGAIALVAAGTLIRASTPSQGRDVFDEIRVSTDVSWLEKIAIEPGAAEAATPPHYRKTDAKPYAYIRLGELASAGSIAAIKRIEEAVGSPSSICVTSGAWMHSS